jgi:AcrR family transcriptional regulator
VAKRQQVSDVARRRCLEAARELLGEGVATELKMEEVARRAGVTRQTLYNQFGSRGLLVEAVFDELARAGGMEGMAGAMQQRDPEVRLREMVMVFARFWSEDRSAMRRVRALAATDAVLQRSVVAREDAGGWLAGVWWLGLAGETMWRRMFCLGLLRLSSSMQLRGRRVCRCWSLMLF